MRALIVNAAGGIAIDDVPVPHVSGECLIRVLTARRASAEDERFDVVDYAEAFEAARRGLKVLFA